MKDIIEQLLQSTIWDILAFVFSLIYVILAAKKNIYCWFFALIASFIYIVLCFNAKLYIDSNLQLFYAVMAVIGWISWKKNPNKETGFTKDIALSKHLIFIFICSVFSIFLGYIFKNYTDQAYPYIDAAIFTFSIFATFLTSQKKPSSWLYFIFIDLVAFPIYWNRNLQLMGVLNVIFAVLAIYGYYSWIKLKKT